MADKKLIEVGISAQGKGKYREAEGYFAEAVKKATSLHGARSFETATALGYLGLVQHKQNKSVDAETTLKQSLEIQLKNSEGAPPEQLTVHMGFVRALTDFAKFYTDHGQVEAAKPLLWKALELCNTFQPNPRVVLHDESLSRVMGQLIALAERSKQHDEAYRFASVQHSILDNSEDLSLAAKANGDLGVLLDKRGASARAEPFLQRSLLLHQQANKDPVAIATALSNLATHFLHRARLREAEPLYEKCMQVAEDALAPLELFVETLQNFARLFIIQQKYDLALEKLERASTIGRRCFGDKHPKNARTYHSLAEVHYLKNDAASAVRHMKLAIEVYELSYGSRSDTIKEWKRQLASYEWADRQGSLALPVVVIGAGGNATASESEPDRAADSKRMALVAAKKAREEELKNAKTSTEKGEGAMVAVPRGPPPLPSGGGLVDWCSAALDVDHDASAQDQTSLGLCSRLQCYGGTGGDDWHLPPCFDMNRFVFRDVGRIADEPY